MIIFLESGHAEREREGGGGGGGAGDLTELKAGVNRFQ